MILIDDNSRVNLDQLAKEYFYSLKSPQNINGNYHQTQSLIGRIENQLRDDIYVLYRVKFWSFFLENHYRNLERVITGRPKELASVILEIENLIGHDLLSNNESYEKATLTSFGNTVTSVFNYTNYRRKEESRNNVEKLNINYCPYCNIQKLELIQTLDGLTGELKNNALSQLDHFYPKSRYPYLGLSFFNLIPGCSPCNGNLKLEKHFNINTHINPFDKSFNEYFKFKLSKIVFNDKSEVEIRIENKEIHDRSSIKDFKLNGRYNDGDTKEKVYDIIEVLKNRSKKVKKSYVKQFFGLFNQTSDISNETLLKGLGVPLDNKSINHYPLGKMKRDICKELGFI